MILCQHVIKYQVVVHVRSIALKDTVDAHGLHKGSVLKNKDRKVYFGHKKNLIILRIKLIIKAIIQIIGKKKDGNLIQISSCYQYMLKYCSII